MVGDKENILLTLFSIVVKNTSLLFNTKPVSGRWNQKEAPFACHTLFMSSAGDPMVHFQYLRNQLGLAAIYKGNTTVWQCNHRFSLQSSAFPLQVKWRYPLLHPLQVYTILKACAI